MNDELSLLLIDKSGTAIDDCQAAYGEEYQINIARDEESGLDAAQQQLPDLILLHIHDKDGAEEDVLKVCRDLKARDETKKIPVILLSDTMSLDEKILSYDAGAYDFITMPCSPSEGLARIKLVKQRQQIEQQLENEVRVASETALSAMAGSSELGQAIRFVERSYDARDYQELAQQFLSVTNGLGLSCCLYFDSYVGKLFFSSDGDVTPLEQELLIRIHQENIRFKDFGKRTFVSYTRVVQLIKNMPLDEPERYGRFKDLFPAMLGAADSKTKALDIEQALIKQTDDISSSFQQVRGTLDDLSKAFAENQQMTMSIMREMLRELDFKLPGMGLDVDQEEYLVERIDRGIVEAETVMDQTENLNAAFFHISELLVFLAEQQQKITDEVRRSSGHSEERDEDAPDGMADVELF